MLYAFLIACGVGGIAAVVEGFFIWHYKNLYHAANRVAETLKLSSDKDTAAYVAIVQEQEADAERYRRALDDANHHISEMRKIVHECQDPATIRDRIGSLGQRITVLSGGKDPNRPYSSESVQTQPTPGNDPVRGNGS